MQEYTDAVSEIKALTERFVQKAEEGATDRYAALESRKLSMDLRESIKSFRKASVNNDKAQVVPRGPRKPKEVVTATPTAAPAVEAAPAATDSIAPPVGL